METPKPGKKRARDASSSQKPQPDPKRRKMFANRNLSTQSAQAAFNGEVDLASFVKAREYEIRALEDGIQRARKGLSMRAFQEVPRELRRRQASHNVKKVLARLRGRASREMVEDNTPTVNSKTRKKSGRMRLRLDTVKRLKELGRGKSGTASEAKRKAAKADDDHDMEVTVLPVEDAEKENAPHGEPLPARKPQKKKAKLAEPPTPPARFRKRQLHKTWLPTHMYHSKRAKMTDPKEPLWRFALPLSPALKSYRPTHRASTLRGAIAWDMSYMSTIGLEGVEKSITNLLRALGVGAGGDAEGLWRKKGTKWRQGLRIHHGWLYERESYPNKPIGPATIIWCAATPSQNDGASSESAQQPQQEKLPRRKVFIRIHPCAFLQLWEQLLRLSKVQKPQVALEDLRYEIGSIEITGPASTESLVSVLQSKNSSKPGELSADSPEDVWAKLGQLSNPASIPKNAIIAFNAIDPRLHLPRRRSAISRMDDSQFLDLLTRWPIDQTPSPSALFSRPARLATNRSLQSQKAIIRRKTASKSKSTLEPLPTDPKIPVLLFATRSNIANGQGRWTLMLPWKCVLPVWYSLLYVPISTGGNPRFGGLQETRQLAFESGTPWFPGDFPGTTAGDAWESDERIKRKKAWDRMPKGKRVEWSTLDLGRDRKGEVGLGWACDWEVLLPKQDVETSENPSIIRQFYHQSLRSVSEHLKRPNTDLIPHLSTALFTARITMVSRGTPISCARIYRLPTTDETLLGAWLELWSNSKGKPKTQRHATRFAALPRDAPPEQQRARLAALLIADDPTQPGSVNYPCVPDAVDLIGFVTTGNYNLGEGRSTAIGSLLLCKVSAGDSQSDKDKLCIIRNAGESLGRLARWEPV